MLVFRAREEAKLYEFMAPLLSNADVAQRNKILDTYRSTRFPFLGEVDVPEDAMKKAMDKLFQEDTTYTIDASKVDRKQARVADLKRKLRR